MGYSYQNTRPSEMDPFSRGIRSFGPFDLRRFLGGGGFSWVYLAREQAEAYERTVVLKVLRPRGSEEEFKAEAETLATLGRHPRIIDIYRAGTSTGYDENGAWYQYQWLAMPYAAGGSLGNRLQAYRDQGKIMPQNEAAAILFPVAEALDYAHRHHRIHRDIKPANVLFGDDNHVLLSDFGIALDLSSSSASRGNSASGTPPFMAPEQFDWSRVVDERTDTYSLGALLFEMLTGELPFDAIDSRSLEYQIIYEPAPSARLINGEISPEADQVLQRALAKDPDDRYQSATELANAYQIAIRKRERPRWLLPLGAVITLLFVLLVLFWMRRTIVVDTYLQEDKINKATQEQYSSDGSLLGTFTAHMQIGNIEQVADGTLWLNFKQWIEYSFVDSGKAFVVTKEAETIQADGNDQTLYLTDERGNRYNYDRLRGSAGRDELMLPGKIYRGSLHFPSPSPEMLCFTFHNDDEEYTITRLCLNP